MLAERSVAADSQAREPSPSARRPAAAPGMDRQGPRTGEIALVVFAVSALFFHTHASAPADVGATSVNSSTASYTTTACLAIRGPS